MTDTTTTGGAAPSSAAGSLDGFSPSQPAPGASPSGQPQQAQDNPRARGHSPARDLREGQPGQVPDRKITIGGIEYTEAAINDAILAKTAENSRVLSLPQSADAYELKLPADFTAPAGVAFEFDQKDPLLAEARKAAHELKMDQAGFSRMLGIYAANKIGEIQTINVARDAELAKLGTAGSQRIDAVKNWLNARLGADKGNAMQQMLVTAKHVEAIEDLIKLFSSQGGGSFRQSGREGEEERGKIPGYENMSFEQRRGAQLARDAALIGKR